MAKVSARKTHHHSGWDDGDLDTDKPFNVKVSLPRESPDKSAKLGWLKRPTLFPGSGGGARKSQAPLRDTRAGSPGSRATSPGGHRAPSPSPRPPSVASTASRPMRGTGPSAASSASSASGDSMPGVRFRGDVSVRQVSPDDSKSRADMTEQLEELRREVKGLHEAFNSLKKEHGELRGELRQGKMSMPSGLGLPVEAVSTGKGGGKQGSARKSTAPSSKDPGGYGPSSYAMLPSGDGSAAPAAPQDSMVQEDPGFFGGILETCGFTSGGKRALTDAPSASAADQQSLASPGQRFREESMRPQAPGSRGIDVEAPLHAAARMEVGGSSSSVSAGRPAAAQRDLSPHIRETPMEGRSNVPGGARKTGFYDQSSPAFGSGGSGHASPHSSSRSGSAQDDGAVESGLPRFGAHATSEASALGQPTATILTKSVGFDDSAMQRPPAVSPLGSSIDSSSTAQRPAWKSPQVGGPLVLPFPEMDDTESESFSPGLGARPVSPSMEAPSSSRPGVPRLVLPTSASAGGSLVFGQQAETLESTMDLSQHSAFHQQ